VELLETLLSGFPKRRGKVRDVYDLGERLLLVATDRISAFDWVLPNGIPDKGRVLTALSAFWFETIEVPTHALSTRIDDAGLDLTPEDRAALAGRSMLVKKADVIPYECVVRGYLAGSAWREYRAGGAVCGERLPAGLVEAQRIDPLFTPATKAETGHDQNISFARLSQALGAELARTLRERSLQVYAHLAARARSRDLILADTKFEWGWDRATGALMLVDEVGTPDSSRYWALDDYRPGGPQPSFDKQFVRDWLESTGWDRASPPPRLPADVVARTREKYIKAHDLLTARSFSSLEWP
jgi:phosphoribosylaminoimidazole-succinocarboxamide synthase